MATVNESVNKNPPQTWRTKIAFYLDDIETSLGLTINLLILGLIFLSLGIFVAETYPIGDRLKAIFAILDTAILVLFTLEYLLRFWSAANRRQFFWNAFSLIDLAVILPLLLGMVDIRFLRIFRWFRILRIIRFWQLEKKVMGLQASENLVLVRIFLTLFSLIFIYAGLIYQVEHGVNGEGFKNFFDAFYFVVVTMTTVGYGDVTPLSEAGRAMTLMMILTGVLFIPWQLRELIGEIVKKVNSGDMSCQQCNLARHDADAVFCKQCGNKLS